MRRQKGDGASPKAPIRHDMIKTARVYIKQLENHRSESRAYIVQVSVKKYKNYMLYERNTPLDKDGIGPHS